MTFDPLNAARTAWDKLSLAEREAFCELVRKGLQRQALDSDGHRWCDANIIPDHAPARICPRALALHEIGQLPGKGPAIRKARDIVRGVLG